MKQWCCNVCTLYIDKSSVSLQWILISEVDWGDFFSYIAMLAKTLIYKVDKKKAFLYI